MKKILYTIAIIGFGWYIFAYTATEQMEWKDIDEAQVTPQKTVATTDAAQVAAKPTEILAKAQPIINTILNNAPFISQAPLGRWSDIRQQDGCEEASALMAVAWARKQSLPTGNAEAEKKIIAIADWEQQKYKNHNDTSVKDTAERILKGYFKFENFKVVNNITTTDIKKELSLGKIVIAPMHGVKLNNPNFTPPGPDHHMLVIIGYDKAKNEFITNDPGTRKGKHYRYSEKTINQAIRDYPTGHHLPVKEIKKNIIVVSKEK